MSIFPRNGLAPGLDNSGVALATTPRAGCEARYYSERCAQKVDPEAWNALISEVVNVINACAGQRYDCDSRTNLRDAITCMICDGILQCASHDPTNPPAADPCDPQGVQQCPPFWLNTQTLALWIFCDGSWRRVGGGGTHIGPCSDTPPAGTTIWFQTNRLRAVYNVGTIAAPVWIESVGSGCEFTAGNGTRTFTPASPWTGGQTVTDNNGNVYIYNAACNVLVPNCSSEEGATACIVDENGDPYATDVNGCFVVPSGGGYLVATRDGYSSGTLPSPFTPGTSYTAHASGQIRPGGEFSTTYLNFEIVSGGVYRCLTSLTWPANISQPSDGGWGIAQFVRIS